MVSETNGKGVHKTSKGLSQGLIKETTHGEPQHGEDSGVVGQTDIKIYDQDNYTGKGPESTQNTLNSSVNPNSKTDFNSDSDFDSDSDSDPGPVSFSRPVREKPQRQVSRRQQTIEMGKMQHSHEVVEDKEVDDTDGLDPVGELEAWKQREKNRVLREYKQLEAIELMAQEKMESRRKRLKLNS